MKAQCGACAILKQPDYCSVRLDLRLRDLQILANLSREVFLDLPMPRYGRELACLGLHINGMAATFTKKTTAMCFEMPNEVDPLRASSGAETFADDGLADQFLLGQRAIGLKNKLDSLAQIDACFVERVALRVGAWQFLDEGDIPPFRRLTKNGS
jgi:hypothetical protein